MSNSNNHSKKLSSEEREQVYQLFKKQKDVPVIPKYLGAGPIPLSFAQQRIWFEYCLNPTSSEYHIPFVLQFIGPLKISIFKKAIDEIVIRHEVLRTCFQADDHDLWQVVIPPSSPKCLRFSVQDLRSLPKHTRQLEIYRIRQADMLQPFNLAEGPILRVSVLHIDENEYIVLITMHHIVIDAWSTGIFFQELSALYDAFSANLSSPLKPLPIQYVDFAIWQRNHLQGSILNEGLAYWKRYLEGAPTFLNLPTDYPRPKQQNLHYDILRFPLSQVLTDQLKAFAQQEGSSFFMIMLAAFQILLSRYSGQNDFLIGFPIANRQVQETHKLVGFLLNTLVLRARMTNGLSFRNVLHQTRDDVFGAFQYQYIPFDKIIDMIQARRENSYHPAFQVMFVLQDASGQELTMNDLMIQFLDTEQMHSRFDITLNLQEDSGCFSGLIQYNTSLFKEESIDRMRLHFQEILANIVPKQDIPLQHLMLLSQKEYELTLIEWNMTKAPYREKKCLHHLFEAQALCLPDSIALIFEDEHITYSELNQRANQLAHYLQSLKIGSDIPVGMCVERSVTMIVSVLAILKSGGVCVPIDPSYPDERIAFLLEDSRIPVLLTQQCISITRSRLQVVTIYVDTIGEMLDDFSRDNTISAVTLDNLAYIIYTSGSTGIPKGICMPHRPLINLLTWHENTLPDAERTLQFASLSFDASFHEIFSAWISGGTVCMITEELRQDPLRLASYLNEHMIDKCILPVVILQQIAEESSRKNLDFPFLKTVITTGEQLRVSRFIQEMFRRLPLCTLHNHYGPSESHVVTAFTMADVMSEGWPIYPPIGRPIANTQLYVLDQQLQPVPIGIPGELYLGGICLARGYLHRPEFTSERFIANPFSDEVGQRLYKTGDIVRYLSDGNLEYIGRVDHQVKLRGVRIELGEIETLLAKHPCVQDVTTLVREDEPGEKLLVAYIVPMYKRDGISSEVRSYLKAKLPDYMIPSSFIILDSLPLTSNGKVDRTALPLPDRAALHLQESYVAPSTEVECLIANVWQEVLRIEQIGLYDNFFELGGHSLLATRLLARLQSLFHIDISLKSLFESPTIAALACQVCDIHHAHMSEEASEIQKIAYNKPIPLSFAQERMWFFEQLTSTRLKSHIPLIFRLTGSLNSVALRRAIIEIISRHEILRTIFPLINNQPQQVILPLEGFISQLLTVCDLSILDRDKQKQTEEVRKILSVAIETPFQLAEGPLMRVILVREEVVQHVIIMVFHHILFDGVSEDVLLSELSNLYDTFSSHQSSSLPSLSIQYADFAIWQREMLSGQILEAGLNYWKKHLSGATYSSDLLADYARPLIQSFDASTQRFLINKDAAQQLRALGRQTKVTLFMILLAAFRVLLYLYNGQDDLLIGTPAAGRTRVETENLIGCFVNTLVLRVDLSETPNFLTVLTKVREVIFNAYIHQDIPFEQIVNTLHVPRNPNRHPLIQVMFLLHQMSKTPLKLKGLTIASIDPENVKTKFDLTLGMSETPEGITGVFEYNTTLFKRETIIQLSEHFVVLLEKIASQFECSLEDLRQGFPSHAGSSSQVLSSVHNAILPMESSKPQSEMEKVIAAIWQEVLQIEKIGVHDNFFDVGGHSLLLIQIQGKVKENIYPTVTMLDLFVHPTIYSLAQYILQQSGDDVSFEQSGSRGEMRAKNLKRISRRKNR